MRRETLGNLIHISDCEPEAGTVTVVYTRRIGRHAAFWEFLHASSMISS